MIKKQSLTKYLIYAFGEIILVVIGILLALQINNRNEYKKSLDNSKVYLKEIVNDLASDTLYLNRMLTNLNAQCSKEKWYLNKTSYTLDDFDSLKMIFPIGIWDYYVNDRTYTKIQSSQASKLIGFDALYKNITDYYNVDKKRIDRNTGIEIRETSMPIEFIDNINRTMEINVDNTRDFSGLNLKFDFPKLAKNGENKKKFVDLMNTIEARNYLRNAYNRHMLLLLGFDLTRKHAGNLIININSNLEGND